MKLIRNQRGAVSLLAITLTSIVISIITINVVSQMAGEVHQSTDAADRAQAQYAAESGAADALAYLESGLLSNYFATNGLPNQSCNEPDGIKTLTTGTGVDPAIACREVITDGIGQGTLKKDQSVQFDLSNVATLDGGSLEIDWDSQRNPTDPPRTFTSQPGIGAAGGLNWDGPPALEITVAYNTGITQVTRNIYMLPQCCAAITAVEPSQEVDFNNLWTLNDQGISNNIPAKVNCYPTSGTQDYDCKAYLPGIIGAVDNYLPKMAGTTQYVMRIKALSSDGDYRVALWNCGNPNIGGTCQVQGLALPKATIDVTAQVGGAYQRIVETPPVRSNPLTSTSYALLGKDNICKTLQLYNEGPPNYIPLFFVDCPATDNSNDNP